MKITIRLKERFTKWRTTAELETDCERSVTLPPASVAETDDVCLMFVPRTGISPAIRVYVGTVLVASTVKADRVLLITDDGGSDADPSPLICFGQLFADWMGITELVVQVRYGDDEEWHKVLVSPVAVAAGKLEPEIFDRLFDELERDSAAVLLDIYGKTLLGLTIGDPLASAAPVAVFLRLRDTIHELDALLHQVGKHPACRLRTIRARELALVGQAVSEATLAEVCSDPGILCQVGGRLALREHLREYARPDYRIPEHQIIADFAEYLKSQLADLRGRIDSELEDRQDRKRWRNFPKDSGKPSWWEAEDLPRIEALANCRDDVARLRQIADSWSMLPFIPPGACLRAHPSSTELFRNHPTYRRVYQVIAEHFKAFRATLDNQSILTRARSLPVLYEWWCAVRVIRIVARGLTPLTYDPQNRPLLTTQLAQDRKRFTIEFTSNQAMTFVDGLGGRVRVRYQPEYRTEHGPQPPTIGLLGDGTLRTPDIALEIFPAGGLPVDVPALIVVLVLCHS